VRDILVFVYALAQPIDLFDGLIPLPRWALRAILALVDAAPDVRWRGDMRHLPSVGAFPIPDRGELFMVVKQETRGTTFIVSEAPMSWLLEYCAQHAEVDDRDIGAWEHTTRSDLRDAHVGAEAVPVSGSTDEMQF
jgi:hypothetical protein